MSITESSQKSKRQDRSIVLHLGNTLEEYRANFMETESIARLIQKVEIADSVNWGHLADGHLPDCRRHLHFTHHHNYERRIKHFDGQQSVVRIYRVRCLDCGAIFTILPSFVVRYKRYETDAIEKMMVLLFITEDSYRMAGVSQSLGMDTQQAGSWVALEAAQKTAIAPRALWALVQWLGQLSPAQLNLALGVEPPTHIIEDEKHVTQNGEKAYVPMVYAPKEALIWWVDYIQSVSTETLKASLERFKALSERLGHIIGATVDGWDAAQQALKAVFEGLTLQECQLHALIKFGQHLATYKRQCKAAGQPLSPQDEAQIYHAFVKVLTAPTAEAYRKALDELPTAFDHEPLASRKHSLQEKQALFQAWTEDSRLAVVTTALDQCMKFFNRKQENMQTFRGEKSGLTTVNAWAITRNCWRFLKGAKRAGCSPLELAGADFNGIPWLQLVNLLVCAWPALALAADA